MGGHMVQALQVLLIIALFFVNVAVAQIPYQDSEFSCLTNAEADRYVKDFNIDVTSFGGKELCDATIDTKKLFNVRSASNKYTSIKKCVKRAMILLFL